MPITATILLTYAVTLAAWLTPQPQHTAGWIVPYGDMPFVYANANYRGYQWTGYVGGGSLESPSDVGKIFWVRAYRSGWRGEWIGPLLSVDCAQRLHFAARVIGDRERAEVDFVTAAKLGSTTGGVYGEVWIGYCPPPQWDYPRSTYPLPTQVTDFYDPLARIGYSTQARVAKTQQYPVECR